MAFYENENNITLTPETTKPLKYASEKAFAKGFFESELYKLGFELIYEPGTCEAYRPTLGKCELANPDFLTRHPTEHDLFKPVLIEVGKTNDKKIFSHKRHQRHVMGRMENLDYLLFGQESLIKPEWCYPLILMVSSGVFGGKMTLKFIRNSFKTEDYDLNKYPSFALEQKLLLLSLGVTS